MTPARLRALVFVLIAAVAAAALGIAAIRREPAQLAPRPAAQRPTLLLLTSLPLLFNEDFSLSGGGSPALKRLATRYRVAPISVTDTRELAKGKLLLMAHPLAQTAENLVALDEWVRAGGRVLLLADPLLEWPSKRPLGDPLRPPPMFMDTGLLAHWGLQLDAPDERGAVGRKLGRYDVLAVSPGQLSGHCAISADRLVAHCHIGKGRATVVADADLLNADRLGSNGRRNLDGVLDELGRLELE
jgi:hypothetical protein